MEDFTQMHCCVCVEQELALHMLGKHTLPLSYIS
jgi:hypothetical protein